MGFTGGSSECGKDGRRKRLDGGASDDVDGRGGSLLLDTSVKISGPLGDQLSSITRRIQLQREAERDTASICHTPTAAKCAAGEGGVGG